MIYLHDKRSKVHNRTIEPSLNLFIFCHFSDWRRIYTAKRGECLFRVQRNFASRPKRLNTKRRPVAFGDTAAHTEEKHGWSFISGKSQQHVSAMGRAVGHTIVLYCMAAADPKSIAAAISTLYIDSKHKIRQRSKNKQGANGLMMLRFPV